MLTKVNYMLFISGNGIIIGSRKIRHLLCRKNEKIVEIKCFNAIDAILFCGCIKFAKGNRNVIKSVRKLLIKNVTHSHFAKHQFLIIY